MFEMQKLWSLHQAPYDQDNDKDAKSCEELWTPFLQQHVAKDRKHCMDVMMQGMNVYTLFLQSSFDEFAQWYKTLDDKTISNIFQKTNNPKEEKSTSLSNMVYTRMTTCLQKQLESFSQTLYTDGGTVEEVYFEKHMQVNVHDNRFSFYVRMF